MVSVVVVPVEGRGDNVVDGREILIASPSVPSCLMGVVKSSENAVSCPCYVSCLEKHCEKNSEREAECLGRRAISGHH